MYFAICLTFVHEKTLFMFSHLKIVYRGFCVSTSENSVALGPWAWALGPRALGPGPWSLRAWGLGDQDTRFFLIMLDLPCVLAKDFSYVQGSCVTCRGEVLCAEVSSDVQESSLMCRGAVW